LIHAAKNYGVRGYGVTLSEQQLSYAKEKIERLGLKDRVRVELKDYAAIDGVFDKAVSIGMAEHVGLDNIPAYFKMVHGALRPGGLYLHHAITRPGKSRQAHKRQKRPEFAALTQYIFPGGELDTIGRTVTHLETTGFEIHDVEGWREHYQRTCRHWHDRLLARMDAAVAEVGSVKARVWLMYLAGCSLAFERNSVGLHQTLASKRLKGASGLPPTRADLYR
jgi:cyclopropane-fatty-acyl-phospholipid synthase